MITLRSIHMALAAVLWPTGCHCAGSDPTDLESESSTSAADDVLTHSSDGSTSTTGEPFDASRWIGRYHYENPFLPFGKRGDSLGSNALINFEILPDSQATIFYDDCAFAEPVTRAYEWSAGDEGWLDLRPGPDEPWLRFLGDDRVDTLRVQLAEPCRELRFEIDGQVSGWLVFRPGESCWVDRCTTPNIMQVDYCEGEEPPPCP